jgi:orotate phosphoribosyltransferase
VIDVTEQTDRATVEAALGIALDDASWASWLADPAVRESIAEARSRDNRTSAGTSRVRVKRASRTPRPSDVSRPAGGPGTELKRLLALVGIGEVDGCRCRSRAATLDRRGPDWCEANVDTIVGWLREEAGKRRVFGVRLPFSDLVARRLVGKAIRRARTASTPSPNGHAGGGRFSPGPRDAWMSAFEPAPDPPRFVTHAQYAGDIDRLAALTPPDVTEVLGVARSGLYPATMLAMKLHLPLSVVRHHQAEIVDGGHGWRLAGLERRRGVVLVVDDTTMTGNSLKRTKHLLERSAYADRECLFASVYVNPAAFEKPDLWAADLPWPHLLEWNLFNGGQIRSMATDLDGVLCRDAAADEDDDGDRYRRFLETAEPRHLVRKARLPMIVTARLERYRTETEAWLARWGVTTDELVMGPWADLAERRRADLAAWKAEHFRRFLAEHRRGGIPPRMFVESDRRLARRIAEHVPGELVVCPTTGECFR